MSIYESEGILPPLVRWTRLPLRWPCKSTATLGATPVQKQVTSFFKSSLEDKTPQRDTHRMHIPYSWQDNDIFMSSVNFTTTFNTTRPRLVG